MDCCVANQYDRSQIVEAFPNISSPEMFDSDTEKKVDNKTVNALPDVNILVAFSSQKKPSQMELVTKSDNNLLIKINKFLRGVPPPPRHTICQKDCSDFLQNIYANRHFFWTEYPLSNENLEAADSTKSQKQTIGREREARNISYQCTKGTSRNLTNAFDTCNLSVNNAESIQLDINNTSNKNIQNNSVSIEIQNSVNTIKETARVPPIVDNLNVSREQSLLLYHTIGEREATTLTWPQAYSHKFYGIQ